MTQRNKGESTNPETAFVVGYLYPMMIAIAIVTMGFFYIIFENKINRFLQKVAF